VKDCFIFLFHFSLYVSVIVVSLATPLNNYSFGGDFEVGFLAVGVHEAIDGDSLGLDVVVMLKFVVLLRVAMVGGTLILHEGSVGLVLCGSHVEHASEVQS
jgi:hypothetical protein